MFKLRKHDNRLLACTLLGAFSALAMSPVCGSLLDADPADCCARNGCAQTKAKAEASTASMKCAAMHSANHDLDVREGSLFERCCLVGALTYPVGKAQPSGPELGVAQPLAGAFILVTPRPLNFHQVTELFTGSSPPTYKLLSTYRI